MRIFQSPNKTGPTDQIVLTPEQAMELGLIPNTSGGATFAQQVKYREHWIIIISSLTKNRTVSVRPFKREFF